MASQNELEKYTRNFILKSLQVIVQSRMGEKCKYTAKENTNEWFTIPIPDIPELTAVAKKTLGSGPVLAQPVNVEISLKRKENNAYLFLEVWSLSLDVENRNPDVKVSSTLYGRMSLVLKSIIAASRVAPAYRLAMRQKKDDFQIHYQYNVGPPNLGLLSSNIQTRHIGVVATPMGTIRVNFHYITQPLVPQPLRPGLPLQPKVDHFSEPRFGQQIMISEPKPCNRKFRNPTSVEDLRNLDMGDKQDTFNSTFSTSPPEGTMCSVSPPPPPHLPQIDEASGLLPMPEEESTADSADGWDTVTAKKKKNKVKKREKSTEINILDTYHQSAFLVGEAQPPFPVERPEDRPFASLMAGLPLPSNSTSDFSDDSDSEGGEEEKEGEQESKEESDEYSEEEEEEGEKKEGGEMR